MTRAGVWAVVSAGVASIAPTLIGGGLTLLGVLITLTWTGQRERQRETDRRKHERETWARDLRYQSHVAFLTEFTAKSDAIDANEANYPEGDGPEPSYDWLLPVWNRYQ